MAESEERRLAELREALDDPQRDAWGGYPWEHLGDAEKDVRWLLDRLAEAERERYEYERGNLWVRRAAAERERAEAAEAALADTRKELDWYADVKNWTQPTVWGSRILDDESAAIQDCGNRARVALAASDQSTEGARSTDSASPCEAETEEEER